MPAVWHEWHMIDECMTFENPDGAIDTEGASGSAGEGARDRIPSK